jgi:hypothetical protein
MDGFDQTSERGADGRFLPGQSGNPAGKRPGTKNRATLLAEALAEGEAEALTRLVVEKALAGDGVAARFLLGRLFAKPRGRAIRLALPKGARPGDVVAAFNATLVIGPAILRESGLRKFPDWRSLRFIPPGLAPAE